MVIRGCNNDDSKNRESNIQRVISGNDFMLHKIKADSNVSIPITWQSRGDLDPLEWPRPNWPFWRHRNKIQLWEAAFLCFDIDPHKRSYQDIDHFDLHTIEIGVCLSQLKKDLFLKEFFSTPYTSAQGMVSTFDLVKLSELAEWAVDVGYSIPKELAKFARKPDSETVFHGENQDINSYRNRAQKKASINRVFLENCIANGISPNIDSIWKYIIENVGEPDFLFISANNKSAITASKQQVQRRNLARQLKCLLNKIKN